MIIIKQIMAYSNFILCRVSLKFVSEMMNYVILQQSIIHMDIIVKIPWKLSF